MSWFQFVFPLKMRKALPINENVKLTKPTTHRFMFHFERYLSTIITRPWEAELEMAFNKEHSHIHQNRFKWF